LTILQINVSLFLVFYKNKLYSNNLSARWFSFHGRNIVDHDDDIIIVVYVGTGNVIHLDYCFQVGIGTTIVVSCSIVSLHVSIGYVATKVKRR